MMKIGIIGSRKFDKYELLKETVCKILTNHPEQEVSFVSGGAKGADTLAEKLAGELDIPILLFKPDYHKFGRSAPLVRNKEIVANSDLLVAFPVGESKGTYYTIEQAKPTIPFIIIK